MKPNFVKLNLNLNDEFKENFNIELVGTYNSSWQKYCVALKREKDFCDVGVSMNAVKNHSEAINVLPKTLLDLEVPDIVLNIIDPTKAVKHAMLGPHRDRIRQCAINFYLNPIGEETKYYSYAGGKVTQVDSFIAKENECWLLNGDIPHSVDLKPNHIRKILSFSFINTPFEKVLEHFE